MKIYIWNILLFLVSFLVGSYAQGQDSVPSLTTKIDGEIVSVKYGKDTMLVSDMDEVFVSSPRHFDDIDEYIRYMKYRRYATKVYPYAVEAIKVFREVEYVTKTMKKKQRKKHIKRLHKQLKKEFTEPLKNLSKTQGKILIKMIEKELDTPFYSLIKSLRGGFSAAYWNSISKLYGYNLKEGYIEGQDKILDAVLYDLDVSYEIK